MNGFKDGELIADSVLARLSVRLSRNKVSIIKNEWALEILGKTGDGAQFVRFKDGSAGILLRPYATRYQLVHELKHYEHVHGYALDGISLRFCKGFPDNI